MTDRPPPRETSLHGLQQGYSAQDDPPDAPRAKPLRSVIVFAASFAVLQFGWLAARGTALERALIDVCTVRTGSWLVNLLMPGVQAQAVGSRITAPGGGINILSGCEGTEVMFLLWAALLAFPMPWRARLAGLAIAAALAFVLNQVRIAALFYALRVHRDSFDMLHGLVAPLVMIAVCGAFFALWVSRYRPQPAPQV